jgi:hypothetical protein
MSEGPSVAMGRPVTSRLTRAGTPAAYAAAVLAFAYAAVSLYWTMGGRLLLETVGGTAVEVARGGGMPAVLLGLTATVLKVVAGLLALVLVRPWGGQSRGGGCSSAWRRQAPCSPAMAG